VPPEENSIEHARVVREVEARLFGGEAEPVRVGRFDLKRRLGAGGGGVVYEARDPHLERLVALKLMPKGADSERVLREARAMARLAHPNVVVVYEVGEHEGRPFVAMERIEGQTLRAWARERDPSFRDKVDVLLAAGRGLAAAHAAGLVHRDFKPENVLVARDGRARVADFGLARDAFERPSATAGTPAYMAPEQLGGREPTPAMDQFAFCVTACELLAGRRPDAGASRVEGLPDRIAPVLLRGLSRDPEQRWPSMLPLLEALDPTEPRRRLRIAGLVVAAIAVAAAIAAAVMQAWLFRDWMGRR
jgi:serine/threonine protein kinase